MFGRKKHDSRSDEREPSLQAAWLHTALGFFGLAGSLFGLTFVVEEWAVPFTIGTVVAAALGAAILLVRFVKALRPVREKVEGWFDSDYRQLVGDRRYLGEIVKHGRKAIGRAHPDEDILDQRLAENPQVLRVCVSQRSNNGQRGFCGYVLLYPLKPEIAKGILSGGIRREAEFGPNPLTRTFAEARFIYVGMVLGKRRHKAHVKDKLREEFLQILASGKVERVFARRGSDGGLKLMREYGFSPLSDSHGVWSVGAAALRGQLQFEHEEPNRIALAPADSNRTERLRRILNGREAEFTVEGLLRRLPGFAWIDRRRSRQER